MRELSREGHRARAKQEYLQNGVDGMPDYKVLELILFYAIPRRDVKDIAYALINRFGDLDRVLKADYTALQEVKGVGESAALLLTLFGEVSHARQATKNKSVRTLAEYTATKEYVQNQLAGLKNERMLVITLNSGRALLSCHTVSDGTVNSANVEPKRVVECAIRDNAAGIILAHNHPGGSFMPSKEDLEFTKFIYNMLKALNVHLFDHIIVGENGTISLNNDSRFCYCFE